MTNYITQLLADLQTVTLNRWNKQPPHYFEMGMNDLWLDPPAGYKGPPFGFGHEENEEIKNTYLATLKFEATIGEVEQFVADKPRITMFDHFGFEPEQFPPAEKLTDEQLEQLKVTICRLWAAYNFTPVFPDETPGRIIYPLLLERMRKPAMVFKNGNMGIEFCDYEPEHCPFGLEWCSCK